MRARNSFQWQESPEDDEQGDIGKWAGGPPSLDVDLERRPVTVEEIRKWLRHRSSHVRRLALIESERVGDADLIPDLYDVAADDDLDLAMQATDLLIHFRGSEAEAALLGGLDHPRVTVRLASVSVLRERRSTEALAALVGHLGDPSAQVRKEIVQALGNYRRPELLLAIRSGVRDSDAAVRQAAVEALQSYSEGEVFGDLVTALTDENWKVRKAAARSIGRFPGPAAGKALLASLDDSNTAVIAEALRSIGRIAAPVNRSVLLLLQHESYEIRLAAVQSVGGSNDPLFAPYLGSLLNDINAEVRQAARLSIARLTAIRNETNTL